MIGESERAQRHASRPHAGADRGERGTYKAQVFKVLDADRTEILFNSTWCNQLGATE